ncbi:MAG: hypothetical protein Q9219_006892 [cf. Caloplaca sp. 3 TL-2023]
MSNRFFFDGSSSSDSGEDTLPYPKPLSRSAFLTPTFDPATYLSTLRNRHQTLEDLRAELRTRSQDISKELLDLVNDNYQDFLSLGSNLQGGDEKVEEVRLGLLGFGREIEGLKGKIDERRREVESLVVQRREVRRQMQLGRKLLNVDYRLKELEQSLMLTLDEPSQDPGGDDDVKRDFSASENESDEGEEDDGSISRLGKHVRQYLLARKILERIGPDHPFVVKQEDRMARIKDTILLDLGNAVKQMNEHDDEQIMKLLAAYRDLGESEEAVKALQNRKS